MSRTYNVHNRATNRWLYDWADGPAGARTVPVWTHDQDKATPLSPTDATSAVNKARVACGVNPTFNVSGIVRVLRST